MSSVGKCLAGLKLVFLTALMTMLTGCGSISVKSAKASAKINVGVLEVSGEIQFEKNPSDESIPVAFTQLAKVVASDSRIEISSSNSQVPNQTTPALVIIKRPNGSAIAGKAFPANIVSGRGSFSNPAQVESWLNSLSIPDEAIITIEAPDVVINPPQQGYYTATNKVVISNQVMASATATGYISPGGGDRPPTHPK